MTRGACVCVCVCSFWCSVVEIGTGSGFVVCSLALLLRELGLGSQVVGVDHSEEALAATRRTLDGHQVWRGACVRAPHFRSETGGRREGD